MSEPYTVVNYVVEGRRADRDPWFTAEPVSDEAEGRKQLAIWAGSPPALRGTLLFRLVKRTAVITDEVVA